MKRVLKREQLRIKPTKHTKQQARGDEVRMGLEKCVPRRKFK
jgi:hypothetical protein